MKNEKTIKAIGYTDTLNINLAGQVSYTDYRNLILGLSFKRPIYLITLVCSIFFLLLSIINNERESSQIFLTMFLTLCLLLLPILTLVRIKKIYRTSIIFKEQINYKLTNDSINIKGETFEGVQKWTSFYKTKETKGFFMFYQGEGAATLLDKKMFTDDELAEFKQFFQSLNIKQ